MCGLALKKIMKFKDILPQESKNILLIPNHSIVIEVVK